MNSKTKTILKIFITAALLIWCGLFLTRQIDLSTADLGEHIKNGQIIFTGGWTEVQKLWHTNLYSFTYPNYSFINHHWGGGVVFYLVAKIAGFPGLSLFYIILLTAAFWFFFAVARKSGGFIAAVFLAFVLLPIITERVEVRPEIFSYFLAGFFFWLIWNCRHGKIKTGWLWLLPVLEIFWVNLHVYFFLGPVIILYFLAEEIWQEGLPLWPKHKNLILIFLIACAATLINPFGLFGALEPLNIFQNYGYLTAENQGVIFLEKLGHGDGLHFILLQIFAGLSFLGFIILFLKNRRNFPWINFIFFLALFILAFFAVRNLPIFALFALPLAAEGLAKLMPKNLSETKTIIVGSLAGIIILAFIFSGVSVLESRADFGLGLRPGENTAADFFKTNHLQGPIFNNFDIGSYLIYYLYPQEKVFVDNRPEAYPVSFFKNDYIPMQEDKQKFATEDAKYNFNAIFFSYRDFTPWSQEFLIRMVSDPAWAPVYADQYNIILLKRNAQNAALIKQFELPPETFGVSKQ
jgi:hypothetical protein